MGRVDIINAFPRHDSAATRPYHPYRRQKKIELSLDFISNSM